jgi:hypothetical protein
LRRGQCDMACSSVARRSLLIIHGAGHSPRYQAVEHPCELGGRGQALRLWSVGPIGRLACQHVCWDSVVHGPGTIARRQVCCYV